ncbi:MAG: class II aldolase/adducin family protein [Thermoplasmata archaeon]|nr:MAG: class II aldolase/adducin family protein [Thermoplasmata archaeon]
MNPGKKNLMSRIIECGRRAAEKGLIWANSGNISHRLDGERIIITGSGVFLGDLKDEDFTVVSLDVDHVEGEGSPSIETQMHTAFYKTRENAEAVFHSQAFFTTLVSCTALEVANNLFPESMAYIHNVGRVPYHHPGSMELAGAVAEKARNCDCIILSNHGAICAGDGLDSVMLKTETLEMLCRLIVLGNIDNIALNYLPLDVKDDFLEHLRHLK